MIEELDRMVLLCRDYVADEVTDSEICYSFKTTRILCVSDVRNLSSHAGQTALITLVSLISRMGMQVALDIPQTAILFPQPPFLGTDLKTALIRASSKLVSCATISPALHIDCDLVFVLGDTKFAFGKGQCWRLIGTEWSGETATLEATAATPWATQWPVGAMVSAVLGAAEAFKFAIRRLSLRSQGDQVFFDISPSCNWTFGEGSIGDGTLSIGPVDIISAGAISQAAIYALTRFPGLELCGRIFDDDLTSRSNLNRNMLSLTGDINAAKAKVAAHRCGEFRIEPIFSRFTEETLGQLATRVLVGVDDIPSRWEVQRRCPEWLAVSGTSHFNVSSSSHKPGQACAGCLHPAGDDGLLNPIPTVSFVSFWAGLAMAVRLVREALNCPYPPEQQHLWVTPLRMDLPHAAMWLPVAGRPDCPVECPASRIPIKRSLP